LTTFMRGCHRAKLAPRPPNNTASAIKPTFQRSRPVRPISAPTPARFRANLAFVDRSKGAVILDPHCPDPPAIPRSTLDARNVAPPAADRSCVRFFNCQRAQPPPRRRRMNPTPEANRTAYQPTGRRQVIRSTIFSDADFVRSDSPSRT